MLDDLGTSVGHIAAIQDASCRQVTNGVGPRCPPLRAFRTLLIELQHAVRLSPTGIVGNAPARNDRPGAVVHDPAGFVLIHPQVNVVARKVSRLRYAADDGLGDGAGDRVRRTEVVRCRVSEKRAHISERSGAGTQHIRILDLIDQLIQQGRIEAIPQADMHWQAARKAGGVEVLRSTREGRRRWVRRVAVSEGPIGARYNRAHADIAVQCFFRMSGQNDSRRRRVQRGGQIGNRVTHDVQRL